MEPADPALSSPDPPGATATGGLAKGTAPLGREGLAIARLAPMSTPSTSMAGRAPRLECLDI
ncbi:MAG: hypothetical protein ACRDHK_06980 [Actinomycetota bacterium]